MFDLISNFMSYPPTAFLLLLPFISLGLVLLFKKDRKFYLFIDSLIQLSLIVLFIVLIGFSDKMVAELRDIGWAYLVGYIIAYIFFYQQFTTVCSWIWEKISKKEEKGDYRFGLWPFLPILGIVGIYMGILGEIYLIIFVAFLAVKRVVDFLRKK